MADIPPTAVLVYKFGKRIVKLTEICSELPLRPRGGILFVRNTAPYAESAACVIGALIRVIGSLCSVRIVKKISTGKDSRNPMKPNIGFKIFSYDFSVLYLFTYLYLVESFHLCNHIIIIEWVYTRNRREQPNDYSRRYSFYFSTLIQQPSAPIPFSGGVNTPFSIRHSTTASRIGMLARLFANLQSPRR